jgi:hypothetical protein
MPVDEIENQEDLGSTAERNIRLTSLSRCAG